MITSLFLATIMIVGLILRIVVFLLLSLQVLDNEK